MLRKIRLRVLYITLLLCCISLFPKIAYAGSKKAKVGYVKTLKASSNSFNKVSLKWSPVKGATNYTIYYKKESSKKWVKLKTVSSKLRRYTNKSSKKYPIVVGQSYKYTVRAYNKKYKKYGGYKKVVSVKTKPQVVKGISVNKTSNGVRVSWKKSGGCNYYYIYRKVDGGKWTSIGRVRSSNLTFTDNNPVKGKKNYYTVRGYYSTKKVFGDYNIIGVSIDIGDSSNEGTIVTPSPKPTIPPSIPSIKPQDKPQDQNKPTPSVTPSIKDDGIKVDKVEIQLGYKFKYLVGESFDLKSLIKVSPENATDKTLIYESTNEAVAEVKDGVITAKSKGTAIIRVYSKCNGKVLVPGTNYLKTDGFTINIYVEDVYTDIESIMFDEASILNPVVEKVIGVGESRKISHLRVESPGNGGNREYIYSSSDKNIIEVNADGVITGKGVGFGTIHVRSKYPNKYGNYISASTTYHVGKYDDSEIIKYLKRDKEAEKVFMEEINKERGKNGLESFKYSKFAEKCSLIRGLYNIYMNIQNPILFDGSMHGGCQNGVEAPGYTRLSYGAERGRELASSILNSSGHYLNNMTEGNPYTWCVVLNYRDPAGIGFSYMIETFGGLYSDSELNSSFSEFDLMKSKKLSCSMSDVDILRYEGIINTYNI